MANLQTNKQKQYYIPLELTPETVITEEYKDCEVRWSKIGCRKVRTILIPATKEQYYEFMRPLWREDKRLPAPEHGFPLSAFPVFAFLRIRQHNSRLHNPSV